VKYHFSCFLVAVCASCVFAQNQVDPRNLHERVIAVVPIIGAGTYADPKRPLFAPTPRETSKSGGIIEYQWTPSDDGKYAVVEFVAKTRAELMSIITDSRTLKAFEKGKSKKADIERELQKYRKDFSLELAKKEKP
jgi:hypothetical protein